MYLQLAERPIYANIQGYKRKSNYVPAHRRRLNEGAEPVNPYIFLPKEITGSAQDMYVREDYFDDVLTDNEFKAMMWQLAPFQKSVHQGMSEAQELAGRAERKKKREERKEAKKEKKETKQLNKTEKANAKNEIRKAKAEAIKSGKRGEAISNVLTKVGDIASGIMGVKKPGGGADEFQRVDAEEIETTEKPFYKKPAVIGIGLGLLALGITVAVVRKKRKKKAVRN